jgi:hypothetical protein
MGIEPVDPSLAFPGDRKIAGRKTTFAAAVITLLLAIVPAVLWPGAISWMNDEPALIINAAMANRGHFLAFRGLYGSFPVPYGPLPTEVYQFLLLFTHDVRVIVVVHALLLSSIFAGSLLWLSRSLRLTPWFAAAVVLGPYIWFCQRVLWDATFTLPLSLFALAAYAAFLRNGSAGALLAAAVAGTLVPLVHLQALPLFVALAGHALWRHRKILKQGGWRLNTAAVMLLALNCTYFIFAIGSVVIHFHDLLHKGHSGNASLPTAIAGPLLGGRLMTAVDFLGGPIATRIDFHAGFPWIGCDMMPSMYTLRGPQRLTSAAAFASLAAIPLVWIGMLVGVVRMAGGWVKRLRRSTAAGVARLSGDSPTIARDTLTGIALTALLLQMSMAVFLRVPPWPQYCFGTFAIFVLFAWLGVDFLQRLRLGLPIIALWGLSMAYITLGSAWQIHAYGWERGKMSPSLNDQIEVAAALNHYRDRMIWTTVPLFQQYRLGIPALRLLNPPDEKNPGPESPHGLLIRFHPGGDPRSSRIELIELHSLAERPVDAKQVNMWPINWWQ